MLSRIQTLYLSIALFTTNFINQLFTAIQTLKSVTLYKIVILLSHVKKLKYIFKNIYLYICLNTNMSTCEH